MKKIKVVLAGNPNAGKTTIFNGLTGAFQKVSNFPGVTVEKVSGKFKFADYEIEIVDIPGTYSLIPYTREEQVARAAIWFENPDVIVDVLDSTNFARNLFLASSLAEYNLPFVLALNMTDLLEKKGREFDLLKLEELTGAHAVLTSGTKRKGLDDLKVKIIEAYEAKAPPHWEVVKNEKLKAILDDLTAKLHAVKHKLDLPPHWLAVKVLEDSPEHIAIVKAAGIELPKEKHLDEMAHERYIECEKIAENVMTKTRFRRKELTSKIDNILLHRVFGFIIMIGVIYLVFTAVFGLVEIPFIPYIADTENFTWDSSLGITDNMDFVSLTDFFESLFINLPIFFTDGLEEGYFKSLVQDGIIEGVGAVMGFLPLIFVLFLLISILEDIGYISRISFMMDRIFRAVGLQGSCVFPLIVAGGISGGCAVPGIMATRIVRSEKERLVTMLVVPFTNCGAKLPVYAMLIAAFFSLKYKSLMMLGLTVVSWLIIFAAAYFERKVVVRGPGDPFILELPDYHMPSTKNVLKTTLSKSKEYLKKAGTIILAINIIMWAILTFPELPEEESASLLENITELEEELAGLSEGVQDAIDKIVITLDDQNNPAMETINSQEISLSEKVEFLLNNQDSYADTNKNTELFINFHNKYNELIDYANTLEAKELYYTTAGRMGQGLTAVTSPLGFDEKLNIAIIGGIAAKEVIVSTLGTAYSMGEVDVEDADSLSERIANDGNITKAAAIAFMIFVMLYAPCFPAVAAIKKESGKWRWALFSVLFNTAVAYIMGLVVYQVLSLFPSLM